MKIVVVLGLSALLIWLIYGRFRANRQIVEYKQTITVLKAKQDALEETPPLEIQLRCSEAAKAFFNRAAYGSGENADFANHYNPKLRKCFIVIRTSKWSDSSKTMLTSKNVFDAVEGKSIGQFVWQSDKVKKYWEVAPILCSAVKPDGESISCKSDAEYSALMADYMDIDD